MRTPRPAARSVQPAACAVFQVVSATVPALAAASWMRSVKTSILLSPTVSPDRNAATSSSAQPSMPASRLVIPTTYSLPTVVAVASISAELTFGPTRAVLGGGLTYRRVRDEHGGGVRHLRMQVQRPSGRGELDGVLQQGARSFRRILDSVGRDAAHVWSPHWVERRCR